MKPSFAPRHEALSTSPSRGTPFCTHMSQPTADRMIAMDYLRVKPRRGGFELLDPLGQYVGFAPTIVYARRFAEAVDVPLSLEGEAALEGRTPRPWPDSWFKRLALVFRRLVLGNSR